MRAFPSLAAVVAGVALLAAGIALAASGLALSGCGRTRGERVGASSSDGGAAEAAAGVGVTALSASEAGQVLAHVGARTVTLGDFMATLEHMDEFDRLRYQSPARRKELLGEMIDVMLLADEARERGYDKDPATQEEVRQILRDAVRKSVRRASPAANEVAADEVRAYYESRRPEFHDPERRRASAIVLRSGPAAEKALSTALASAAATGSDSGAAVVWGDLVRAQSTDASAKSQAPSELAGDLGFVSPPGDVRGVNARIPDPVRQALFDIPHVGDVFPRVVSDGPSGRFYVLKLAAKVDAHDLSFEDAERSIRVRLAASKARANEDALVAKLRTQYAVQVDEAALSRLASELANADAGSR